MTSSESCSLCGDSEVGSSQLVNLYGNDISCGEFGGIILSEKIWEGSEQCLNICADYFGCTLTLDNIALAAGTTPRATTVKLYSARPTLAARHTRNARNPRPDFCTGLKIGGNVIVRASKEERNLNLNEDYFVAKIERKAAKLDEAGMYSAQPYQKNDWIVYVCWYIFPQTKQIMVVTGSIQEEMRNGFLVIQSLEI